MEQNNIVPTWFLGPRGENREVWQKLFNYAFEDYVHWRRNYKHMDPIVLSSKERRNHEEWEDKFYFYLDQITNELKSHFPFYSPRYIAHMLSEQTLPSVIGLFAGMLYNANNVTDEAAPDTVKRELEVGKMVSQMIGYDPEDSWAHICSGGTIANIEALWVARTNLFIPNAVREYCVINNIQLPVRMPNQHKVKNPVEKLITEIDPISLLKLRPNKALYLPQELAKKRAEDSFLPLPNTATERERHARNQEIAGETTQFESDFFDFFHNDSEFNVSRVGMLQVLLNVSKKSQQLYNNSQTEKNGCAAKQSYDLNIIPKPIIFAPPTCHYSVEKAAEILGLGKCSVRYVDVDDGFRMKPDSLKEKLNNLQKNEFSFCVIGVVGTTEEGAVDPIHEINRIRDEFGKEQNCSFWIHADAAWGGYFNTVLNQPKNLTIDFKNSNWAAETFNQLYNNDTNIINNKYAEIQQKMQKITLPSFEIPQSDEKVTVTWKDENVIKSLLSIHKADSVTLDPHKMGYLPYPNGMIAFQNKRVLKLISQEANYIDDGETSIGSIQKVGPYILEGSKPGSAAASAWLAHKTIPLHSDGHGKIVKSTLLSARLLYHYLDEHINNIDSFNKSLKIDNQRPNATFRFIPLYEPDTNLVCFVAIGINNKLPREEWTKNNAGTNYLNIREMNCLNKGIYNRMSMDPSHMREKTPHAQPYFVSRTTFKPDRYKYQHLKSILDKLNIKKTDYEAADSEGLFVLRSTIMNPWYLHSIEKNGKNYLLDFVKYAHICAAKEFAKI